MIYALRLEEALLVVGLVLALGHLLALVLGEQMREILKKFPRSETAGNVLFVMAAVWFWGLVRFTDLGEFSTMRMPFQIATGVGLVTGLIWMREFLAVRALGMLCLLGAEPLLESAWMRPESGRLWLVTLAYGWILLGLFFVGKPYLLRNWIGWVTEKQGRWTVAMSAGVAYGLILLGVRFLGINVG